VQGLCQSFFARRLQIGVEIGQVTPFHYLAHRDEKQVILNEQISPSLFLNRVNVIEISGN
jgi:hypothetical protein